MHLMVLSNFGHWQSEKNSARGQANSTDKKVPKYFDFSPVCMGITFVSYTLKEIIKLRSIIVIFTPLHVELVYCLPVWSFCMLALS
jgi:hypothetical protein